MTSALRTADRDDPVIVDWLRCAMSPMPAAHAAHAAALPHRWCPGRCDPRAGAPTAAPLRWEELDSIGPDAIRLGDVGDRLGTDAWANVPEVDPGDQGDTVERKPAEAGIELEPFDRVRS
jgi:DNA primase